MATIAISNLHPGGSDLLSDSESFMGNLSEKELGIQGGLVHLTVFSPRCYPTLLPGITTLHPLTLPYPRFINN